MPLLNLCQRPDLFPLVAAWLWKEWSHLLVEKSQDEFEVWFTKSRREDAVPATFVWLEAGQPVATVSLEIDDMDIRPELTPWLASLYVVPEWRGRGIGKTLVRAAEDEARDFFLSELYLFTPEHADYYAALGWEPVETCVYRGVPVAILRRELTD
jgi:predicted N-acetyltransferase YhbS